MRADYSISCDGDTHKRFQNFAGVMIFVYPVGIPVLFFLSLLPHAAELSDVPTRESRRAKSKHLSFFAMDYAGKYWSVVFSLTLFRAC